MDKNGGANVLHPGCSGVHTFFSLLWAAPHQN